MWSASSPDGQFWVHPRGSEHFDWNAAGVWATAVGTVLLAAFTGLLAWTTNREVTATHQLANEAERDRLLRDRPLVVITALDMSAFAEKEDADGVQIGMRGEVRR
jgi:hypothetical protein